jgi:hypothetical protein
VDAGRAERFEPIAKDLHLQGVTGILVFKPNEGKGSWKHMKSWSNVTRVGKQATISEIDPGILPEDNATIFFTSGIEASITKLY